MMTLAQRTLLTDVAIALFGVEWRSGLARQLEVNPDTVRRWFSGRETVPPGVWGELASALEAREREVMTLRHATQLLAAGLPVG